MTKDMLIRSIDQEVADWIERTKPAAVSREEYLRQVIGAERRRIEDPQATLFPIGADPERVFGSVPFRFIDLFAGIGGFRCALTKVGGTCVYTSEWDKFAATTYEAWYGERPDLRDIREVDFESDIPDHDVLAAGFPCQPFSLAGVSKKNSLGRRHGFEDETQGNLFFSILDIIAAKQPPVLLLENVKNLKSHDKGNTWHVIRTGLEDSGYRVFHKIIDASGWVPQHRERIFIVGFREDVFNSSTAAGFEFPRQPEVGPLFGSILESAPDRRYMLSNKLWKYLKDYKDKHAKRGNGFGYGIADPAGVSRTMSARYHKDGSEILIRQKGWRNPRRLTPREASRLLGFDDRYAPLFGHGDEFPLGVVSDTQAYRQFGNAVVPKVVEAVAEQIVRVMAEAVERTDNGCLLKGRLAMETAA